MQRTDFPQTTKSLDVIKRARNPRLVALAVLGLACRPDASRAEPAPFIGDDLFATFDEDRTAYGLAALAEIGHLVQRIVFTHDRHVAELARTKVEAEVLML